MVFFVLNIILPLAEAASLFLYNAVEHPTQAQTIAMITTRTAVGLLQIITGLYLGYAIYTIRTFLNLKGRETGNGEQTQINVKMLAVHAVVFGLYMVCVILYNVMFTMYYLQK